MVREAKVGALSANASKAALTSGDGIILGHLPVTVGAGLDVTAGQLVTLDLSEVAAGGELEGTLNAPTVVEDHSGSSHAETQAAAEATAAADLDVHEAASDPHPGYTTTAELSTALGSYQPLDSDLTAIAALSTTSYGRALLALADAAAGRTAFGLGTASTHAHGDYDAAGAAAAAQAASQPLDSDLTAIAALTTTSYGRSLLATADAAALRTLAATVIGTDVQAWDTDLDAIAALTTTSYGRSVLAVVDAAALRTLAGLVIGTDVEAHDADLTTFAGLTPTNDDVLQRKAGAWANRTIAQLLTDLAAAGTTFQPLDSDLTAIAALSTTSFGRSVLEVANAAALRTLASAVIGTDVQAWDADLDTIAGLGVTNDSFIQGKAGVWAKRTVAQVLTDLAAAGTTFQPLDADLTALAGLTSAADKLPYFTGSGTASVADFTAAARTLLDDATVAAMATTLGLGTASTPAFAGMTTTGNVGVKGSPLTPLHVLGGSVGYAGELGSFLITGDTTAKRLAMGVDSSGSMYGWIQAVQNGVAQAPLNLQPEGGKTKINGVATRSGTDGTGIDIFNSTAPSGTLSNGITLYAASGELRVMDSAGNSTLLSPHDDANFWVYDSVNTVTGEKLHIEVERILRFINDKYKLGYIEGAMGQGA